MSYDAIFVEGAELVARDGRSGDREVARRKVRLKEIGARKARHLDAIGMGVFACAGCRHHPGALRKRQIGPDGDDRRAVDLDQMRAEHLERVVVIGTKDAIELVIRHGELHRTPPCG